MPERVIIRSNFKPPGAKTRSERTGGESPIAQQPQNADSLSTTRSQRSAHRQRGFRLLGCVRESETTWSSKSFSAERVGADVCFALVSPVSFFSRPFRVLGPHAQCGARSAQFSATVRVACSPIAKIKRTNTNAFKTTFSRLSMCPTEQSHKQHQQTSREITIN